MYMTSPELSIFQQILFINYLYDCFYVLFNSVIYVHSTYHLLKVQYKIKSKTIRTTFWINWNNNCETAHYILLCIYVNIHSPTYTTYVPVYCVCEREQVYDSVGLYRIYINKGDKCTYDNDWENTLDLHNSTNKQMGWQHLLILFLLLMS